MTRPAGSENLQEHTGRVGSRSRRRGQEVTWRQPSFSVIYLLLVIELRVAASGVICGGFCTSRYYASLVEMSW